MLLFLSSIIQVICVFMFIIDYNIIYVKLDLCSIEYCGNVAISLEDNIVI